MNQNQGKNLIPGLLEKASKMSDEINCTGISGSCRAYMTARLFMELEKPVVVIVPSLKDADRIMEDLSFFLKELNASVLYFPPYNIKPFKPLAYHNQTAAMRISILYRLMMDETPAVVVVPVDALMQKIIPRKEISGYAELIMAGEELDRESLISKLISGGYVRTAIVEEPGDFSVRGGIIDIFSPLNQEPFRIEFFGDTVDSLRSFSAATQRKIKSLSEAVLLPAREIVLKKENIAEIAGRIRMEAASHDIPATVVKDLIMRIKEEGIFPGIESLVPIIYTQPDTFFDYLPDKSFLVMLEPGELESAAEDSWNQANKNYLSAVDEGGFCVKPEKLYEEYRHIKTKLSEKKPIIIRELSLAQPEFAGRSHEPAYDFHVNDNSKVAMELKNHRKKESPLLPVIDWFNDKKKAGFATLMVCSSKIQADRLKRLLAPYDININIIGSFPLLSEMDRGGVYLTIGRISSGFVWHDENIAVITEDEIFDVKHRKRKTTTKPSGFQAVSFSDLKQGELVVHVEHGVGRYQGLVKLKLEGATNDFLLIVYRDDDKLYLPVDRMTMVSKYMGMDGYKAVLDKIGGKSWGRIKSKVKKSVEKIAGDLLKLYAARKVEKGFAFNSSDSYFDDFEAGFPYEETPDQLKAIEDVLHDMEKPAPMDRLVCGDVGYGKTEVALRASFKAVNSGKQVALVAPTTVLVEQHMTSFADRFKHYPVNISCLSRFRSKKEQQTIVKGLKDGSVDIVIGTHRLLQKDIGFKDIGLIVLDEEQRFGVKHKEKLKQMRSNVDVLALTATPIPRTLHMSMMGVRDISVISTPPEQRKPIITYICKREDAIISDAIKNEIKRDGQAFFIHNSVNSIWAFANHLKKLVPDARFGVAHGRMPGKDLDKVMFKFMKKEIDVLVCTTIVESGLDVPSANTIFVNRADRFGLSQMYQIRGRVGRADEQAYAYLFIPDESALSKDAKKRLKVLMEHSDLGSGFQIAMNDLKIRGGGTILGASQSGHIAAVGYDMFLKLMENAMLQLKGKPVLHDLEPEINMNMSCFIPESYISDIDQRLTAYRRMSKMTELKEIADFNNEMVDRFGKLPQEASNLFVKIMFKVLCIKAGIKKLGLNETDLSICFSELHQSNPLGIIDMIASEKKSFRFTKDQVFIAGLEMQSKNSRIVRAKNILKEIALHVNG